MENQVRHLRKQAGMTQKKLGWKLGVAESTVSQYETGKRNMDNETLLKLGEIFNVSIEEILGRPSPSKVLDRLGLSATPSTSAIRIPVLGDVAAGIPIEAIEDIVDYEEIDAVMASSGEFFGLRIKGSSMEPRMREGDVVIVRKQDSAETGDTVVVLVNGDSATVKKIKIGSDGISLIPTNPVYDPMFYTAAEVEQLPVRILGKVVELRAKF